MSDTSPPRRRSGSDGLGGKMAGGNPAVTRGRAHHDYYDTPDNVTEALLARYPLRLHGAIRVWEPCAGRAAMARVLRAKLPIAAVFCTDIVPATAMETGSFAVRPLDLLQGELGIALAWADAVITNPPFNLAASIIKRLCGTPESQGKFVALLLKSTFWHAAGRHNLFLECQPTHIHPLLWRPDFEGLGAPTMDLSWNVWCPVGNPPRVTMYEPMQRPGIMPSRPLPSRRRKPVQRRPINTGDHRRGSSDE